LRAAGFIDPVQIAELDAYIARLDDEYFDLQEATDDGTAGAQDYLPVFCQARAVAALSFAGRQDALQGAMDAVYEAAATTDNKDELTAVIRSALR